MNYSSFRQLADAVIEAGGVKAVTMEALRDLTGAGKLGSLVRDEIGSTANSPATTSESWAGDYTLTNDRSCGSSPRTRREVGRWSPRSASSNSNAEHGPIRQQLTGRHEHPALPQQACPERAMVALATHTWSEHSSMPLPNGWYSTHSIRRWRSAWPSSAEPTHRRTCPAPARRITHRTSRPNDVSELDSTRTDRH